MLQLEKMVNSFITTLSNQHLQSRKLQLKKYYLKTLTKILIHPFNNMLNMIIVITNNNITSMMNMIIHNQLSQFTMQKDKKYQGNLNKVLDHHNQI